MLKQPITFEDFNGVTRTEEVYFNLTEEELVDWQADSEEGLQKEMQDAIIEKNQRKLLNFVKTLVRKAYGERDKDGLHFNKSEELSRRFENSAMYSPLLMSLFADEGTTLSDFINGLMPADLVKRAMEQGNIPNPDDFARQNGFQPDARQQFEERMQQIREAETPQPGHNVGAPLGLRRDQRTSEDVQLSEQTGYEPTLTVQSANSPQDAAPVQIDRVPEQPQSFRVEEQPLDPAGNVQADADPDYQEYLRKKAAGEL